MRKITIYRQYFTNSTCYQSQVLQKPTGIQVHSTGANNPYLKRYVQPDDGRLGQNYYENSHNRPGVSVCANAYIGKLDNGTPAIYQTLPWDCRCWLSGSGPNGNANKIGYIGYEMCEDGLGDQAYFNKVVMTLSVCLDAYLCHKYNIPVSNIHDHAELHDMGLASDHGDIKHWLKRYGLTMDDYRKAVQNAIDEGVQVTYIEGNKSWIEDFQGQEQPIIKPETYTAIVTAKSGSTVNLRDAPSLVAAILTRVPLKTEVEVLETVNDEWKKIRYNTLEGYMMSEFLVAKKEDQPSNDNDDDNITITRQQLQELKDKLLAALKLVEQLFDIK